MPIRYRFSISIDDEFEAEDIDEAWELVKARWEDRFYGPTSENITTLGEIPEEETE